MAKKFNITKIMGAAAGGVGGVLLQNQLGKIKALQDKPKVTPLIVTAAGAGLMYFAGKSEIAEGVGSGMVAVGSATLAGTMIKSMQGFSRVNVLNGVNDDDMLEVLAEIKASDGIKAMVLANDETYPEDGDGMTEEAA